MKDALMLHVAKPIEADLTRPLSDTGLRQVERFLYREARLLDHEDYHAWLETLEPDIHYWMPGIETRRRGEERGAYQYGEMAYFDDDLTILKIRVARYDQPTAWADNPATRHIHQITNIEAFETWDESLVGVYSCFTNIRNRNLKDQDILYGRREDLLRRRPDGSFGLARRRILLAQDILLSKNLNTFL